ncbi:Glucosamine-phosphate N-acetyltransferase-like protein [Blyttiomyces sp. JEL0837]|nr:Glucosamine-phosphate N-acetyltransferase-like protein [Blyttiomyces sp. JEL0837]
MLFDIKYISPDVVKVMPPGYIVRPLAPGDYEKGFLETLGALTTVGKMSKGQFMGGFKNLRSKIGKAHNHEYFTIVIEDTKTSRVVGAGTIFVERKFVHQNGLVGHIEDIVTAESARGLKLGLLIIETLKYIGKATGCYKIILDCSDKNIPFYVKCGFTQKEYEMVMYIPENDRSSAKL